MMETVLAAHLLQGRLLGRNVRFTRVCTDTRHVGDGDLFVALKGERFDGHDFVTAAFERGAIAALVARDRVKPAAGTLIEVEDPLAALGRLAAHWRHQFRIPVVVVVGSNGKTTVKEMTAAILRAHYGDGVLSTATSTVQVVVGVAGGDAADVLGAIGGRGLVVVVRESVDAGSGGGSAPAGAGPTGSVTGSGPAGPTG